MTDFTERQRDRLLFLRDWLDEQIATCAASAAREPYEAAHWLSLQSSLKAYRSEAQRRIDGLERRKAPEMPLERAERTF